MPDVGNRNVTFRKSFTFEEVLKDSKNLKKQNLIKKVKEKGYNLVIRIISVKFFQIITKKKDSTNANEYALVKEVEGQQEVFVDAELEGPMVEHRGGFKKKEGGISVNSNK